MVDIRKEGDQISARVVNSGAGLQPDAARSAERPGVGLANIKTRLQLHYGTHSKFFLREVDPTHVEAAILLPLMFQANGNGNFTGYGE